MFRAETVVPAAMAGMAHPLEGGVAAMDWDNLFVAAGSDVHVYSASFPEQKAVFDFEDKTAFPQDFQAARRYTLHHGPSPDRISRVVYQQHTKEEGPNGAVAVATAKGHCTYHATDATTFSKLWSTGMVQPAEEGCVGLAIDPADVHTVAVARQYAQRVDIVRDARYVSVGDVETVDPSFCTLSGLISTSIFL